MWKCKVQAWKSLLSQEEFHTAADLLRKALWTKDKTQANNEEITSPEFVENALSEEGAESTALQNPDTSTRNSKLLVAKNEDSNSLSRKAANNSCNFEPKLEQDKGVSKRATEDTKTLTSEENSSTGQDVGSFIETTGLEELRVSDINAATTLILEEPDSDSEDELEQFVFQPKGEREGNCNLSFT